jgi:hypothetical protein
LARELAFEILEWRNTMSEKFAGSGVGASIYQFKFALHVFRYILFCFYTHANFVIFIDGDDADDDEYGYGRGGPSDQEALFTKFQAFLTRASSCQSIFTASPVGQQFHLVLITVAVHANAAFYIHLYPRNLRPN